MQYKNLYLYEKYCLVRNNNQENHLNTEINFSFCFIITSVFLFVKAILTKVHIIWIYLKIDLF